MSREMTTSSCCSYTVTLSDLRGKPVEFRKYRQYRPVIGVRWDCPECGTSYFASYKERDSYWSTDAAGIVSPEKVFNPSTDQRGKFVVEETNSQGEKELRDGGCFIITLSYYETYNDEPSLNSNLTRDVLSGKKDPAHLYLGDAHHFQWVW